MSRVQQNMVQHMSLEPRLKGKVAFISGASRGFGQAIAIRFVEEGAKVVCFSRSGCEKTLQLIGTIKGLSVPVDEVALSCRCDISDEKSVKAMVAAAQEKFGDVAHVLINNAALFIFESVETATPEDWDRASAVNIKGHALVTKHTLPLLKQAGGASIVFQGSISSYRSQPGCATYATMKGALVQMARNCAHDFAKYGIRVNSVCAGTIETPISQQERASHGWSFEEWEALKIKDVILQRVGDVREIANATLFYACDESTYCTGGDLMVDGGASACTVATPFAPISSSTAAVTDTEADTKVAAPTATSTKAAAKVETKSTTASSATSSDTSKTDSSSLVGTLLLAGVSAVLGGIAVWAYGKKKGQ